MAPQINFSGPTQLLFETHLFFNLLLLGNIVENRDVSDQLLTGIVERSNSKANLLVQRADGKLIGDNGTGAKVALKVVAQVRKNLV
jgi:hypothetical protein